MSNITARRQCVFCEIAGLHVNSLAQTMFGNEFLSHWHDCGKVQDHSLEVRKFLRADNAVAAGTAADIHHPLTTR